MRRERLPWPKDKTFKILSLDGGGIRGIFTSSLLAQIEEKCGPSSRIADYFDMIAGTSTGGIIALALGLRKPASIINKLYLEDGKAIFPPFWQRHPLLAFLRRCAISLHDHHKLEEYLFQTFQEETLGSSCCRLVIPAFKTPQAEIVVLKTDHHPDFKVDWRMLAWEAARATSAAPTYFRGHSGRAADGEDYVFLDGGVWANNPAMAAVIDALTAYDLEREQIRLLSIGTGNKPFDVGRLAVRGGLFQWMKIIEGAMFLTTDNASAQATLLLGPERVLRIEPDPCGAGIALNDWTRASQELPGMAKRASEASAEQIEAFFKAKVDPRERFYTR